jgi:hypothetical protein
MALSGNLRDFNLPDVFQLVSFSAKTGVLDIVREDGAQGSIYFKDGEVFFATSNWNRDPLGLRLVKARQITQKQLEQALAKQMAATPSEPKPRLGELLVAEEFISDKTLEAFVQEQIQDTIFDLMRWDEGEFEFKPSDVPSEEDIGLSVSIENVIMEGSRRIEEWARIKKKIPSLDIVFKMATAPGEGTFEISLKPSEWRLITLVDGTRDIQRLAQDLGFNDFEVCRILYGMYSAGLLEIVTGEELEKLRVELARKKARAASEAAAAELRKQAEDMQPGAPVIQLVPREGAPEAAGIIETVEPSLEEPSLEEPAAAPAVPEAPEAAEAPAGEEPRVEAPQPAPAPTDAEVQAAADAAAADAAATAAQPAGGVERALSDLLAEVDDTGAPEGLGMESELSALTGSPVSRQPVRPEPEPVTESASSLHLDHQISKETVLKIIDGLKSL